MKDGKKKLYNYLLAESSKIVYLFLELIEIVGSLIIIE